MSRYTIKPFVAVLAMIGFAGAAHAQSASEDRAVGPFSRLNVQNGIDVYLTQGAAERLRVEVDGVELADVVSEVVGDELRLYREGDWRGGFFGERHIRAYLDFVQLSAIEASGGSDVETRGPIEAEELAVRASGGSDVELDVHAASLEFTLSGGSDLDARGATSSLRVDASGGSDISSRSLDAEHVSLRISGGSDASVRASRSIDIDANGGSDVEVYGEPADRTVDNDRSSDVDWR